MSTPHLKSLRVTSTITFVAVCFTALQFGWANRTPSIEELSVHILEDASLRVEAVYSRRSPEGVERRSAIRRMSGFFRLRTQLQDTLGGRFDLEVLKFWGTRGNEIRAYRGEDLASLIQASQRGSSLEIILSGSEQTPEFRVNESAYAWAFGPTFAGAEATHEYHQAVVERIAETQNLDAHQLEHLLDTVYLSYSGFEARSRAIEELSESEAPARHRLIEQIRLVMGHGEQYAHSIEEGLRIGLERFPSLTFEQAQALLGRLYPQGGSAVFALGLEKLGRRSVEQNQSLFDLAISKQATAAAVHLAQQIYTQTPRPNLTLLAGLAEQVSAGDLRDELIVSVASRYTRITYAGLLRLTALLLNSERQATLITQLAPRLQGLSSQQVAALAGSVRDYSHRMRALDALASQLSTIAPDDVEGLLALGGSRGLPRAASERILSSVEAPNLALLGRLSQDLPERDRNALYAAHLSRVPNLTIEHILNLATDLYYYPSGARDEFLFSALSGVPLPSSSEAQRILGHFHRSESSIRYAQSLISQRGTVSMSDLQAIASALRYNSSIISFLSEQITSLPAVTPAEALQLLGLFDQGGNRDRLLLALSAKIQTLTGSELASLLQTTYSISSIGALGDQLIPRVSPKDAAALRAILMSVSYSGNTGLAWIESFHSQFHGLDSTNLPGLLTIFGQSTTRDRVLLSVEGRIGTPNRTDVLRLVGLAGGSQATEDIATRMLQRMESANPVSAEDLRAVIDHIYEHSRRITVIRTILLSRPRLQFSQWYPVVANNGVQYSSSLETLILDLIRRTQDLNVSQAISAAELLSAQASVLAAFEAMLPRIDQLTSSQLLQLSSRFSYYSSGTRDRILEIGVASINDLSSTTIARISERASSSASRERILAAGLARLRTQ